MTGGSTALAGQRALVTGASSGIGAAAVRALAAAGAEVHALARRAERLATLAQETGCHPLAVDINDGPALSRALDGLEPDILVNNAGLGAGMAGVLSASREDLERTIGTNVTALLDVLRLVLPGMVARQRGHVVNIGSVAGIYPVGATVYGGSKGAVRLLSQNLRLEIAGSRVRVTEICPGRVETEFYDVAMPDPEARARATDTGIEELAPSDVADAMLYALSAPAHVNVATIELAPVDQVYGGVRFTRRDR